ncbi:hypothetical protein [Fulvivirga lutea]|uniref:Uncharacterized protein n=1 Tax=Fulvivirga lutea TaxID=2810512 RepID=A0A975A2Y2_9BACT|nr:hypothetical protein [Fulvivirga lutea]QSE99027.1 hypothetical protein JR347_08055 [Fulvivirga lutea]
MSLQQDPIKHIARLIETKSSVKQETYRNLCHNFKTLEKEAKNVVKQINEELTEKDKGVTLSVTKINDQEFHVKVAGDLLVFILHTNIIVLDAAHRYNKSPYVQENEMRKYLGQINIYNFMADSFKYNRLNDPGYLIARLFCNYENHFLVEGERQLSFMYENVSEKPVTNTDLNIVSQLVMSQCIDNDLVTAPFPDIRVISLHQKIEKTQALGGGYKIGFQMSYQQKLD